MFKMYKTVQYIVTAEDKLIFQIQNFFGPPSSYVSLIKFGKIITKQNTHYLILQFLSVLHASYKILSLINWFNIDIINQDHIVDIFLIFLKYICFYQYFSVIIQISRVINKYIKNYFQIRRPYVLDEKLKSVIINKDKSKSFSFPSNSIQNTFIVYSCLLHFFAPQYYFVHNYILFMVCGLISFIKLLRALHYPHDIIVGIIIAKILFVVFTTLFESCLIYFQIF